MKSISNIYNVSNFYGIYNSVSLKIPLFSIIVLLCMRCNSPDNGKTKVVKSPGLKMIGSKFEINDAEDSLGIAILAKGDSSNPINHYYTLHFHSVEDQLMEPINRSGLDTLTLFPNRPLVVTHTVDTTRNMGVNLEGDKLSLYNTLKISLQVNPLSLSPISSGQKNTNRVKLDFKGTLINNIINEQLVYLFPYFYTKHTNNIANKSDFGIVEVDYFSTKSLAPLPDNFLDHYGKSSKIDELKTQMKRLATYNCFDDFYDGSGPIKLPSQDSIAKIASGEIKPKKGHLSILPQTIIDHPQYSFEARRANGQVWACLKASYPVDIKISKDQEVHITQYIEPLTNKDFKYNQLGIKWDFLIKTLPGLLDAFVSKGNCYLGIYAQDGNERVVDIYSLQTGERISQYRLKQNEHLVGSYWSSYGTPIP